MARPRRRGRCPRQAGGRRLKTERRSGPAPRGPLHGLSHFNPELVQFKERVMRHAKMFVAVGLALMTPGRAGAQVAGSTLVGVAAAEMREVATGWSAKRQVLGQPVFNKMNEKVGTVDDIII